MELRFDVRWVGWSLALGAVVLTLLGAAGQVAKYVLGHDFALGFVPLFDVSLDSAVPTWYASTSLLLCALLLALHAGLSRSARDGHAAHWAGLAVLFLVLSVDETATIHETMGGALGYALVGDPGGLLHYAWVVPGMMFAAAVGLAYHRFLFRVPVDVRTGMVLAGVIFLGGAIGAEMLNARYAALAGTDNLRQQLGTVIEEGLEMAGVALFARTLALHLGARLSRVSLEIVGVARVLRPTLGARHPEFGPSFAPGAYVQPTATGYAMAHRPVRLASHRPRPAVASRHARSLATPPWLATSRPGVPSITSGSPAA